MKRTLATLLFSLLLLASCSDGNQKDESKSKIQTGSNLQENVHPSVEVCGEKTCALQKYLEDQERNGKFNLEKARYFQNRFGNLLIRHSTKDELLKASEYQQFVKAFNNEYFPCDWKVEVCHKKSKYSYDEQNFIWYIFLPQMVAIEFTTKHGGSEVDAEAIIQSIRRKYFATYDEKEAMIQVWKDKLRNKAKKISLTNVDKERIKKDKQYFEEVVLTPGSGLYDKITENLLSPIPWQEGDQLIKTASFGMDVFFSKLSEIGISKDLFYATIGTSDQNFKKLDAATNLIEERYGLSKKMPYDRYLRHDEIANYLFTNLAEFNTKGDFNKDVITLKHYILLQYAYGDPELYNMPERAAKFHSVNNFMSENLLKYSKYMNDVKL